MDRVRPSPLLTASSFEFLESDKSSRVRFDHSSSTDWRICAIRPSLKSWDSHLSNGGGLDPGDDFLEILWADWNGDHPTDPSVPSLVLAAPRLFLVSLWMWFLCAFQDSFYSVFDTMSDWCLCVSIKLAGFEKNFIDLEQLGEQDQEIVFSE